MLLAIIFDTNFSRLYMHDALLTTLKSTLNTNLSDYTPKMSHQPNEQAVLGWESSCDTMPFLVKVNFH